MMRSLSVRQFIGRAMRLTPPPLYGGSRAKRGISGGRLAIALILKAAVDPGN